MTQECSPGETPVARRHTGKRVSRTIVGNEATIDLPSACTVRIKRCRKNAKRMLIVVTGADGFPVIYGEDDTIPEFVKKVQPRASD